MQALSRRDREHLRHREEILAAAEATFAQKGFHNATMEEIAHASEFAIGSLYKHFRSKEAIFRALLEEKLTRLVNQIEEIVSQPGPFLERFDAYLEYYADFASENQAFFQLFHSTHETAEWHKEDIQQCMRVPMERYARCLRDLMARGVREGCLRPLDPADLAAFNIGTLHGFIYRIIRSPAPVDFKQLLPVIRSLLLEGAGAKHRSDVQS